MEQFNRDTYKKQNLWQQFYHSCLGKIIILLIICLILLIIAIMSRPTEGMMSWQMEDNIRECLQDTVTVHGDVADEAVANFGRIFTHADTTLNDKEVLDAYHKYNRLEIYPHTFYRTARIHNDLHPEGVRVGVGIFSIVIPTVSYNDLVIATGPVRGDYDQRLIQDAVVPDDYVGENPNVKPYHYQGNPDN